MDMTREELDAKLAANLARLETVEVRMDAKLDAMSHRLETGLQQLRTDFEIAIGRIEASQREFAAYVRTEFAHMATTRGVIAAAASSVITIVVAIVSILSFSDGRFSAGMGFMSTNVHEIELLKQKQAETDARIDRLQADASAQYGSLSEKLDVLIKSSSKP